MLADTTKTIDGADTDPKQQDSRFAFLACLRVFLPAKYMDPEHRGKFYGLALLGVGAFGGVLATAYVVRVCLIIRFVLHIPRIYIPLLAAADAPADGHEPIRIQAL